MLFMTSTTTYLLHASDTRRRPTRQLSTQTFCRPLIMNRPRNRQPRPPRDQQNRGGRVGHNSSRPSYSAVPNIQQVVPGASVSIVLKQDQPTGREVQGEVQDLLTRGDHPRGIKVRLQDGRVGRVQRMADQGAAPQASVTPLETRSAASKPRDHNDQVMDGLPPRTLADYLPASESEPETIPRGNEVTFSTATAKCPICGLFEGDEIAVSRHVETHFT